ncbi:MAG: hypothetical protein KDK33_15510 [Leptospiraceae bacterium]|nr:hypothetical protein [Leptospiraceae bacterium]
MILLAFRIGALSAMLCFWVGPGCHNESDERIGVLIDRAAANGVKLDRQWFSVRAQLIAHNLTDSKLLCDIIDAKKPGTLTGVELIGSELDERAFHCLSTVSSLENLNVSQSSISMRELLLFEGKRGIRWIGLAGCNLPEEQTMYFLLSLENLDVLYPPDSLSEKSIKEIRSRGVTVFE